MRSVPTVPLRGAWPVQTLDRYVFRELLPGFAVTLTVLTFIALVDRVYQLTDLVIVKGVPPGQVLRLLLLMLPSFLTVTLPFSLLIATALVCARLAADGETTALHGAGLSPGRLLKPFMLAAFVLTVVIGTITLVVDPWTYGKIRQQLATILTTRAESGIEAGIFSAPFEKVVVYAEELDPQRRMLKRLFVSDERRPAAPRLILAQEGAFLDGSHERVALRLWKGVLGDTDLREPRTSRFVRFDQCDITLSTESPDAVIEQLRKRPRELPLLRLFRRATGGGEADDESASRAARLEAHKRFALPLVPLVFVVAGYPLAALGSRRSRSTASASALAIAISYYVMFTALEGAVVTGHAPPASVWLPDVPLAVIGVWLMWVLSARTDGFLRRIALELGRLRAVCVAPMPSKRRPDSPVWRTMRGRCREGFLTTIDRYVATEYMKRIAAGIGVIAVLLVSVELVLSLDELLEARPPALRVIQYFALHLVSGLYEGLPMATLTATVFLFMHFARHHELVAFHAAGVSLHRVSFGVLIVAAGVTVAALGFQETILPIVKRGIEDVDRITNRRQQRFEVVRQSEGWYRLDETHFMKVDPRLAAERDPGARALIDVEVEPGFRVIRHIQNHVMPISTVVSRIPSARKDMPPSTAAPRRVQAAASAVDAYPAEAVTLRDLRRRIETIRARGGDVRRLSLAVQSRLAFPFAHVAFAILVIPVVIRLGHHQRARGAMIVVLALIAYWLVHAMALAAAKADLLPTLLGAWVSNLVFIGIGTAGFLRART